MAKPRVMVIGLDCAAPELVFERYRDAMPQVSALMNNGTWGPLRSSAPPITVPAWTCMVSGRDAGELGLYGFRNRVRGTTELRLASGDDVRVKRVWDWLGEHGYSVAPLFVPLTSPPRPVLGQMVSGFMHPGGDAPWCFPSSLQAELEQRFGAYLSDVDEFRSDDLERIYRDILAMTEQHFEIARWVWEQKKPSFMMMVEIGVDRFHHAFWRHIDPEHPRHEPGNAYASLGREFYGHLDAHIGRLCADLDDDTSVMVVSDHGARAMHGGVCLNEWLIERGYLSLRTTPTEPRPLRSEDIDWEHTSAWAEGGYYARVFFNLAGREPRGIVQASEMRALEQRLCRELAELRDEDGAPIPTEICVPRDYYRETRGFPPDLMVYFDALRLRAIGSVGAGQITVTENDTGPDTCNHAWDGVFIMAGGPTPPRGRIEGAEIYDLTPTILSHFGISRPPGVLGRDWTK
jgi:predicted AlkP superfamily phosphohydrolase/phosphomutase